MFLLKTHSKCCNLAIKPIVSISVRNFSPRNIPSDDGTYRGEKPIRIGYEAHHHNKGALPRLSIQEKRLPTMPITIKEDEWSRRRARMDHIPEWLRGYRANREYSVLMRKRKEFDYWKYTKPLKWLHLEQRIKFLYRRLNNKYAPPNVELLSRSRHKI